MKKTKIVECFYNAIYRVDCLDNDARFVWGFASFEFEIDSTPIVKQVEEQIKHKIAAKDGVEFNKIYNVNLTAFNTLHHDAFIDKECIDD